jgi:two-component SAPR family response regulator
LIDDERPALDELSYLLRENAVEVIGSFQNTTGALDFILRENPDIVFLDIELRGVNGIDFGVELQNSAGAAVIFVTAYPEYALEAFHAYPLDYIVKPVDEEHLARTLRHVRETTAARRADADSRLSIRCFGTLEITYGGRPIRLPTKKTRELLAYLLCSEGTAIYRDDLMRLVFRSDGQKSANNLRVSLFRVRKAFQEAGVGTDVFFIQEDLSAKLGGGVCDIVDFQRFLRSYTLITAKNAARAEQIAALVSGGLLTDLDALWATEKQEWVLAQTEKLLVELSVYYLTGGCQERAEAALRRLLSLNSISEQGYLRLLDLYMQAENVLKYCLCYERYREMLHREFGVLPQKIFADYYEKCTNFS